MQCSRCDCNLETKEIVILNNCTIIPLCRSFRKNVFEICVILIAISVISCGRIPTAPNPTTTQAFSNMQTVVTAINSYCIANQEAMPPNLQTLVISGFLPASALQSPAGPALDGGSDYWLSTSRTDISTSTYPSIEILIYDRATAEQDNEIIVGFYDCSVKLMTMAEFTSTMQRLDNAGVDFALPQSP